MCWKTIRKECGSRSRHQSTVAVKAENRNKKQVKRNRNSTSHRLVLYDRALVLWVFSMPFQVKNKSGDLICLREDKM